MRNARGRRRTRELASRLAPAPSAETRIEPISLAISCGRSVDFGPSFAFSSEKIVSLVFAELVVTAPAVGRMAIAPVDSIKKIPSGLNFLVDGHR